MSENSIEFSLSNSKQRDSWLNSSHWTLDADTGIEVISAWEWNQVLLLSQSLNDLGTTQGECLGRTQWSSPLDLTTYLYYFTSGCVPIIT